MLTKELFKLGEIYALEPKSKIVTEMLGTSFAFLYRSPVSGNLHYAMICDEGLIPFNVQGDMQDNDNHNHWYGTPLEDRDIRMWKMAEGCQTEHDALLAVIAFIKSELADVLAQHQE